ncbi:alpha-glucuronidase family glycosyl hydrolase [Belliella kenyensis]|uniref:Xylan alpha-1,2-glucuronidase n=1 Tax=Belliella kenyensis TaxID=1472724 RepID=A0ABV8EPU6_9BACT|nr:alpha-glucuronidase family glycosyl hydrolase [Belliella kenyensis]MCH7402019.1 alpha-glucuronidase [Belliella kenyensis]MDN3605183.1 alpha-glucuronidase family glycosyl hydrolase [Belliella kenyensis]
MRFVYAFLLLFLLRISAFANDGYKLWLQYYPIENPSYWQTSTLKNYQIIGTSETIDIIKTELETAAAGLISKINPSVKNQKNTSNALLIAKYQDLNLNEIPKEQISQLGNEGYAIFLHNKSKQTVVTANSDIGLLYGTFRLLQMIQVGKIIPKEGIFQTPKINHRVLNHWDNLDRTVERGYAGFSIWNWHRLPRHIDQQYHDYARANASIGINGTVLTNVNANSLVLTPAYLEKVKALADVFRPYGIKVYLTARFSSPIEIGKLPTADPLDEDVQAWWKDKAKEIYEYIPDFGGFVVKADSEGQPGPHNYKRTQADGANMLAEALEPYGGIVMWRAFVYSEHTPDDRHKQAYNEFKPLDGKFKENVIIQVKNGAIDFQPREPFHPMFGAMPATPLMMEFQITQEYLGHDTHLAFLAPLFEEVLKEDTFREGAGSQIAKVIDGTLHNHKLTAMAGVANIGSDRNWTGHHFHQANWYTYGKMAWDPYLNSAEIAEEWLKLTFTSDKNFVEPIQNMMLASREMVVNYMTPLGLHHIMAESHHYGPGPWVTGGRRADWTATYYHQASETGIGFDRTKTGSNALEQYAEPIQKLWGDVETIPEEHLLWFHHLPWSHKLQNGKSLWDNIAIHYQKGVDEAKANVKLWETMQGKIDHERFAHVHSFLKIQAEEAIWWKDACLAYFSQFSKLPLPDGVENPAHDLEYYKSIKPRHVPGI